MTPKDDHADNERAPPLTESEYAKTFKALAETRSNSEYDIATKIAGQVIEQRGFNSTPINLLSIGAGLGGFETRLVSNSFLNDFTIFDRQS